MKRVLALLTLMQFMPINGLAGDPIPPGTDSVTNVIEKDRRFRVLVDAGFAHWTSDRFRTAILGKDFGFGISIHPGIPYLQLKGRYDFSTIRTVEGDSAFAGYHGKHIGFTALEAGAYRVFSHKTHSLLLCASGGAVLVGIEDRDLTTGMSATIGVHYLFSHPEWDRLGIGISMNFLSRTYNLTDQETHFREWISADKEILDRDLNLIMGVAFYF